MDYKPKIEYDKTIITLLLSCIIHHLSFFLIESYALVKSWLTAVTILKFMKRKKYEKKKKKKTKKGTEYGVVIPLS